MSVIKQQFSLMFLLILFLATGYIFAHCDSVEGPVVKAAQKALETGNVNYVLIWVQPQDENTIKDLFSRVQNVRKLNDEAKELADNYFFETVVRVHRAGEGVAYTGIKPAGYEPEEGISEADEALENNSVEEIIKHYSTSKTEVQKLFDEVQSKKNYDLNDVEAGREYVSAYVHFIHYVEELYGGKPAEDHHH